MKNEKINKLVLDKVASYELTQPRKGIFDYYNKVMFQTPLLEKDERPSNQYKMRYIKTLQNQIDEKKKEKINKKKAEIKKEKKELNEYNKIAILLLSFKINQLSFFNNIFMDIFFFNF